MNITLVGHGRLGKLISTYLGRDFTLNILEKNKSKEDLENIKNSQIIIFSVPISNMPAALQEISPYMVRIHSCSIPAP